MVDRAALALWRKAAAEFPGIREICRERLAISADFRENRHKKSSDWRRFHQNSLFGRAGNFFCGAGNSNSLLRGKQGYLARLRRSLKRRAPGLRGSILGLRVPLSRTLAPVLSYGGNCRFARAFQARQALTLGRLASWLILCFHCGGTPSGARTHEASCGCEHFLFSARSLSVWVATPRRRSWAWRRFMAPKE